MRSVPAGQTGLEAASLGRRGASLGRDLIGALYGEWQVHLKSWRLAAEWAIGPLWTLLLFAPAMAGAVHSLSPAGANRTSYATYLLPGLLVMNAFAAGQATGFPVWIDRITGEIEVHFGLPVRRGALLFGRVAGAVARNVLQGLVVLAAVPFLAPDLAGAGPWRWVAAIGFSAGLAAAVGLAYVCLACVITNQETFNVFINFLNTPLLFTSSIYYPLQAMPAWLRPLALVNPLTHGAAVVRAIMGGAGDQVGLASQVAPGLSGVGASALFLAVFWLAAGLVASRVFERAVTS